MFHIMFLYRDDANEFCEEACRHIPCAVREMRGRIYEYLVSIPKNLPHESLQELISLARGYEISVE